MVSLSHLPQALQGRILVAGAGVSGLSIAKMLSELHCDVVVADDNETARHMLIEVVDVADISTAQAQEQLDSFSIVVTSPGWRPTSTLLVDAHRHGLEVIGDVELAWRLDQAGVFGEPHTWLAVTGTNGKTTTTSMLAAMMNEGGFTAKAVGNIGIPVSEALVAKNRIDVLVAELSSFQLHWSPTFTPDAGVVLNLAEDHIDWHGSMRDYALAKMEVLKGKVAIIGADDPYLVQLTSEADLSGLIGFTVNEPATGQLGVKAGELVDNAYGNNVVLASADGINPAGPAGVLDALAAAAVARSQGVAPEAIARALDSFEVAGHRGQVVAEHDGVHFIDNSKATNPHAADSALAGHDSVIWVVGGQLKGADIAPLVKKHEQRIKAALVLGADRAEIVAALKEHAPQASVFVTDKTEPFEAMEEIVTEAFSISEPGDTVLLAPAAASLDMFKGMGQRGDLFAHNIIGTIKGLTEEKG
ncbi:UDP-N-acetylmuramoyl-L-alanine--D-glutamate ligase [Corynebacterium glutamicum]|uniref:UDP-N-acetylmuramoyl-L-alanine--D-glutamate ligase n=1 Tax=Corynebacterium glutamicum TaxID=1718 RepID=UPI0009456ED3|nr:UDP-N-acetylmuramoyl-L-alanine--D-glutamate ligase [Corynebacterium glutamicum]OKX88890.1 UDP-N-acetylmuramoylalanine--D-glutamate ligase [Corynebacterium glutamicum]QDX76044.1 UDP-N-acetylmuramoyl-L-alanyl-D-glutamate synthetase [Corynebacterium glutamicum]QDX78816.1 UDP-N-acetylmuramoyl-L-alanyl-D-glutamate synthetase [Corynebacterium glutamicum]TWS31688.1 UDP-N-acetylmuramoyl-L-alanyl-D-glutamate synthetase [Corynebacterium glutamicum]TWS32636.1 UDP-N-acetylmuramoyl-L-alanyl-D-glutamate 